jgi:hypothetical protein
MRIVVILVLPMKNGGLTGMVWVRIPEHPDGDSGNIRTRNRRYPDTLPANLIVK